MTNAPDVPDGFVRCDECKGWHHPNYHRPPAPAGNAPRRRYLPCETCRGRGFVLHNTGYLKSVIGLLYRGRVARDFCFDCKGTGSVEFKSEENTDG